MVEAVHGGDGGETDRAVGPEGEPARHAATEVHDVGADFAEGAAKSPGTPGRGERVLRAHVQRHVTAAVGLDLRDALAAGGDDDTLVARADIETVAVDHAALDAAIIERGKDLDDSHRSPAFL